MTIGALAQIAKVRPSAIRYYERLGLLPAPVRRSGRRDYDEDAVARLALVQFALSTGFTLRDTAELVRGFSRSTPASARWRAMAEKKRDELDAAILRATQMKALLARISTNCHCDTLVECGRGLARNRAVWAADRPARTRRGRPG